MESHGSYWDTRAEKREARRRNARKMGVSGRSYSTLNRAIIKRVKGSK